MIKKKNTRCMQLLVTAFCISVSVAMCIISAAGIYCIGCMIVMLGT